MARGVDWDGSGGGPWRVTGTGAVLEGVRGAWCGLGRFWRRSLAWSWVLCRDRCGDVIVFWERDATSVFLRSSALTETDAVLSWLVWSAVGRALRLSHVSLVCDACHGLTSHVLCNITP